MSRHELTDEEMGHFPLSGKLTKQSNSVPKLAVSSSTGLVRSNSFDSLSWRTSDQRYLVLKSHLLLPPAAANRKHRLLLLLQLPLIWPLQCPDANGHTFVAGTSQQFHQQCACNAFNLHVTPVLLSDNKPSTPCRHFVPNRKDSKQLHLGSLGRYVTLSIVMNIHSTSTGIPLTSR